MKLSYTEELVTPEYAKKLLEANVKNRRLRPGVMEKYTRDMIEGRWKEYTSETIKIATTGRILDGQNRLLSIIQSNKSFVFTISRGLEEDVFDVLDTGSQRSAADVFKISGIKNETSIPAIIAFYNFLKSTKKSKGQINNRATNAMLLDQYYQDPEYWQSIARYSHVAYRSFAKIISVANIGGYYAYFSEMGGEKGKEFMDQFTNGASITNQAISHLRNKLIQDKVSLRKMPVSLKVAFVIKTWNYFAEEREIKLLKYDPIQESFPKAIKI